MLPREARQFFLVRPPRASQIAVLAASNVVSTFDLSTMGNQTRDDSKADQRVIGVEDSYVTVFADGNTIYVAFGATAAAVSALNPATNATNGASGCIPIPAGTSIDVFIEPGSDRFIGFVTSAGTGQLRIAQTSVPGKIQVP